MVTGAFKPTGKLPFTPPASEKVVLENKSDLPGNREGKGYALFPSGHGLRGYSKMKTLASSTAARWLSIGSKLLMMQNPMKQLLLLLALLGLLGSFRPGEKTWVAIGDSITYLNDHPEQTGHRITKGYLTGVTEKLPYLKVTNQGRNGWTAVGTAQQIEKLGWQKADLYTVFLGTNDWWQGRPLGRLADYTANTGTGTVYGAFRVIIDKLRSLNPQAQIVLITPMQRADFVYIANFKNNAHGSYQPKNGQTLEAFAQAVDSIGRHARLPVVDLYHLKGLELKNLVKFKRLKDPLTGEYRNYPYPDFIGVPFNPDTDEYPYPVEAIAQTYDGLHPSDSGYERITRQVVKAIRRLD